MSTLTNIPDDGGLKAEDGTPSAPISKAVAIKMERMWIAFSDKECPSQAMKRAECLKQAIAARPFWDN